LASPAAGAVVSIQSAELTVGGSHTVPIMLADVTEAISCATISISSDPAILKLSSVQNSSFDKLIYYTDTAQGKTTIVLYQTGAAGLTGTFTLAELTFEALAFLAELGKEKCARIKLCDIDMWDPYIASIRENTTAEIVYDLFHVAQKITEAVDEVRKQEFARRTR
jgi:hypothetical protein